MSATGERVIRGYWNCPYCDSKDIDGLADNCPNCGRHKPEYTKYHMKVDSSGNALESDVLSEKQLTDAGISLEECDGEHEEWVCNYCNSLNNWADIYCAACGSPRVDATKEYGMKDMDGPVPDLSEFDGYVEPAKKMEYSEDLNCAESMPTYDTYNIRDTEMLNEISKKSSLWSKIKNTVSSLKPATLKKAGGVISAMVVGVLGMYLFWPIQEIQTVTNFSWNRSIIIEEERTVKESDWSVPSGGRVYEERSEIHHYDKVIDHYETVEETKSREVFDHYETVTVQKSRQVIDHYDSSYTDNGNGTFTEHKTPVYATEYYTDTEQKPVYRTEYYTETHEEPVYRDEPVYQTKYYYEIDKWFHDYSSDSAGNDKNPYWNMDYVLEDRERDSLRYENYYVYYTDDDGKEDKMQTDYDDWVTIDYGDQVVVTTSRIGIDYKVEKVKKEGE